MADACHADASCAVLALSAGDAPRIREWLGFDGGRRTGHGVSRVSRVSRVRVHSVGVGVPWFGVSCDGTGFSDCGFSDCGRDSGGWAFSGASWGGGFFG
ncbi:hypothetical protein J5X84_13790 [Streptosporangiaceae bacterium NEAU-GS5]|nr:hypothetical protein [Streptosporangiaceae bacterium NEAU-GS5]